MSWVDVSPEVGRRERKKAATRAAIAAAALRLFLERGYHAVSVKDIADAADVAVTTLFKHFPGKEALVFDEDEDIERDLVASVARRPDGRSILDGLECYLLGTRAVADADNPELQAFRDLVHTTPELDEYSRRMWLRHADALARAIVDAAAGAPWAPTSTVALTIARFALDTADLARRADDPAAVVEQAFALLRGGWPH